MNIITKTTTINTKPQRTRNAKPVYCITDGKVYASALDAASENGVSLACISHACIKKTKSNGKRFCYVVDMHENIIEISTAVQTIKTSADKYAVIERKKKQEEEVAKYLRQAEYYRELAQKAQAKAEELRRLN